MSRGPCPAPRPVNGGEAGRKQLPGYRGLPAPTGACPRGCSDPGASGITQALGRALITSGPAPPEHRRPPEAPGQHGLARPRYPRPRYPRPCPCSAPPGPGLESVLARPGPASPARGSLGTEVDKPGRGRRSVDRGTAFGAGRVQLFPRHPAHPAGMWGKASGKSVCVLLGGFGWGHEGTTLPIATPKPGRSAQQFPPDRQLAIVPGFPCRVGLAPVGECLGPTMSRPKQLITKKEETLPHLLPVPCWILPEPLQAPHPFESAGRMSTCFYRGFIAGC